MSVKLLAGTVKLKAISSFVVWSAIATETTGVSLTLDTVTLNSSNAEAPTTSIAVTLTLSVPTSPFTGVPLKVPVLALKLSQLGNTVPSDSVAL